jgi:hypothetical protein
VHKPLAIEIEGHEGRKITKRRKLLNVRITEFYLSQVGKGSIAQPIGILQTLVVHYYQFSEVAMWSQALK